MQQVATLADAIITQGLTRLYYW